MEQLDFLWIDYPLPDLEVKNLVFYTEDLGGKSCFYQLETIGRLLNLGEIRFPLSWQYWEPILCSYSGGLRVWTSLQVDGDHSQRFEYRLKFENGWLESIEKL